MRELTNPKWIQIKGGLFLALGMLSAALLLMESPNLRAAALLAVTVWAFCRFYYFAFYVMERYVDASYKYEGLVSLLRQMWRGTPRPKRDSSLRSE